MTGKYFRQQTSFLCSVSLMLLLVISCNTTVQTRNTTGSPALSPTTRPATTPTSFTAPDVSPVARPAGWTTDTSSNWCGYTFPQGGITGVRGTWTEPSLSAPSDNENVVTWVGIGGWNQSYNNIVQIGTRAYVAAGQVHDYVWYETLPPNHWIMLGAISPGDHVAASIELQPGSHQTWKLLLVDLTSSQQFTVEVSFTSMRISADFVVEDPDATSNNGPPYFPFPRFTPITLTKANVRYNGAWTSVEAVQGIQITLIQSGVVLARPGPLAHDAFTVQRVLAHS